MASQTGLQHLRVEAEEVRARLQKGEQITLLDARGERAREEGPEIPGAIRVDSENFQVDASWPPGRFTVVIDAGHHEATAARVAQQLQEDAGFTDVHVLRGGIDAWQGTGSSSERPPKKG